MLRFLVPLGAVALIVAVHRAVARNCRRHPRRRLWFILGSLGALCLAGLLVPWLLAKLSPPWSESPAGIFIYLGKAVVVGVLGLGGIGALIGAVRPGRSDPPA